MSVLVDNLRHVLRAENLATLVRVAVWIAVGIPAVSAVSRSLRRYMTRKYGAQQALIASRAVLYLGLSFILFTVLAELGFKLSTLLGAAGIVGVAVGFASQTSVSNIISGLFLMAERAFEVDDVITVGDITGQVLSVDMLSVKIRTFDNKFVRVPNENLIKSEVTNITRFPIRRLEIPVGVAYKEDVGRVRDILLEIAHEDPLCLNEPEPLVVLSGFGSSSVDLVLMVWATKENYLNLKNSIMETVKKRFDAEGIEIPFPHLSLYAGSATEPLPIRVVGAEGLRAAQ